MAEGVKDLATAQVPSVLDCEELQGYYFSRPLPVEQLELWARQHLALPATGRDGALAPV